MLSVRTLVNGSLSQRLVKDKKAPYSAKEIEFTSTKNDKPTKQLQLYVNPMGEPTQSRDFQNNQCTIISDIELQASHIKTAGDEHTSEARTLAERACDVMLELGYDFYYGLQDISDSQRSIFIGRYRRTVGSGEIENFKLKPKV